MNEFDKSHIPMHICNSKIHISSFHNSYYYTLANVPVLLCRCMHALCLPILWYLLSFLRLLCLPSLLCLASLVHPATLYMYFACSYLVFYAHIYVNFYTFFAYLVYYAYLIKASEPEKASHYHKFHWIVILRI